MGRNRLRAVRRTETMKNDIEVHAVDLQANRIEDALDRYYAQ
jgi:hypothetical protein